VKVVIS